MDCHDDRKKGQHIWWYGGRTKGQPPHDPSWFWSIFRGTIKDSWKVAFLLGGGLPDYPKAYVYLHHFLGLDPPVIVCSSKRWHPFKFSLHVFCGIFDFSQAIVLIQTKPFPRKLGKRRCHRYHHRNAEKALVDPLLPCYVAAPNTAATPCLAIPPRLPDTQFPGRKMGKGKPNKWWNTLKYYNTP